MREIPCCFQCWPGGPVTPPPCRKCGSTSDYYTSGLCARCHPHSPGERSAAWLTPAAGPDGGRTARRVLVDSCPDCHAWGTTRTSKWLCKGCSYWRATYPEGRCLACRRTVTVDRGSVCRLCRKQRILIGRDGPAHTRRTDVIEANRHGQQLFLADTFHRIGAGIRRDRPVAAPPPPVPPPAVHRQLVLFPAYRDLAAGMRRGFPPPADPLLAAALYERVREHATLHGWGKTGIERAQRGVRILLGTQDTPGAPVNASDVMALSTIRHSVRPVLDVLRGAGMLADDRVPPVLRWFDAQTADLPEAIRAELAVWLQVMREGSATPPRYRPRSDQTTKSQMLFALPALRRWAANHPSLREISRDDVLAVLPAAGSPRSTMLQGLRSIFRVLKARQLVFVNPTRNIQVPKPHATVPPAIDLASLRKALYSGQPVTAALAALIGFHALRVGQVRALQVTDLHDGRLHLGDHVVLLAEPVRQRLAAWLDHRTRSWPNTANTHLFIHYRNATTTTSVTPWWIGKQLGISPLSIRQDRILDEAQATGGDIRALCDLFGLSITGAYRYLTVVEHHDLRSTRQSTVEDTDRGSTTPGDM